MDNWKLCEEHLKKIGLRPGLIGCKVEVETLGVCVFGGVIWSEEHALVAVLNPIRETTEATLFCTTRSVEELLKVL